MISVGPAQLVSTGCRHLCITMRQNSVLSSCASLDAHGTPLLSFGATSSKRTAPCASRDVQGDGVQLSLPAMQGWWDPLWIGANMYLPDHPFKKGAFTLGILTSRSVCTCKKNCSNKIHLGAESFFFFRWR